MVGCLRVGHERGALYPRRDFFEHRKPLAGNTVLVQQQSREVAARTRQAGDEAGADRIGDVNEHDRDYLALPLQRGGNRRRMRNNHVGLQSNQLFR